MRRSFSVTLVRVQAIYTLTEEAVTDWRVGREEESTNQRKVFIINVHMQRSGGEALDIWRAPLVEPDSWDTNRIGTEIGLSPS